VARSILLDRSKILPLNIPYNIKETTKVYDEDELVDMSGFIIKAKMLNIMLKDKPTGIDKLNYVLLKSELHARSAEEH
jgi:hypothetical protein